MRRTAFIASSVAIALVVSVALAGTVAAKPKGEAGNLNLVLKDFKYTQVDNPPLSAANASFPGTGDLLVFSATVTNAAGATMGSLENSCTVTIGDSANWKGVCYAVYDLRRGAIYTMSRSSTSLNIRQVVVGGSGLYAEASGVLATKPTPNAAPGSPVQVTVTFTR